MKPESRTGGPRDATEHETVPGYPLHEAWEAFASPELRAAYVAAKHDAKDEPMEQYWTDPQGDPAGLYYPPYLASRNGPRRRKMLELENRCKLHLLERLGDRPKTLIATGERDGLAGRREEIETLGWHKIHVDWEKSAVGRRTRGPYWAEVRVSACGNDADAGEPRPRPDPDEVAEWMRAKQVELHDAGKRAGRDVIIRLAIQKFEIQYKEAKAIWTHSGKDPEGNTVRTGGRPTSSR